jgi:DNA-binding response OmpR family regulator
MRILVLEDDYSNIQGAFEYLNAKFYNGQLDICDVPRSQDVDRNQLSTYDKIFVDVSLQKSSAQDGYAFIKSILPKFNSSNIIIITGSDNVNEKINEHGLGAIKILKKPISFQDIKHVL